VSPDGRWVSFISLRDGPPTLFVQQVDGADARVVTLTAGRLLSHAWSPDGNSIACVIQRSDGLVLQVFQAFFGGAAQQTVPVGAATARVLRWIDRRVYLLSARGDSRRILQVVDLDTGSLTNLTESWVIDGTLLSLDVRPDGRQAVAAVRTGGRDDLWLTPLDAWRPERLTNDEFYELNPIWSGTGRSIIYSTNRGGQDDLWELVVATGRHRALTSSQTEERPGGVSADDRVITFSQNEDEARVWFVDPAVPVNRQLTADAMSDLTPALSADGTRLVFQRSQPSPAQGFQILDSKLFSAGMTGGSLLSEPRPAADGFAGLLSPDGARLAYLQRGNEPGRTTLFVRHLGTDDVVRVSATARLPVLTQFPVEWAEQLVAWSPAGDALYYVDRPDETFGIRRFRVGAAEPDEPLFRFDGEYIRDLHVSPDGTRLAFLTWTDGVFELHAVDLESGRDQVLAQLGSPLSRVFNRGWMPDARRVVLISVSAVHEDVSADIDVLIASAGRQPEVVATVANGFAATTRLDPARAVLYLTRVANGVHNAYAVGLEGRGVVPVTDNRLPGVTFSGIRPVPGGGLIVVQNERKRDIWVIETADK
jgi:Tol biopolymer transport system component